MTLPERARPGARSSGHGAAVAPGRARNGRRGFQTAGQRNRATLRAIEESLRNVLVSSPADGLACVVLRTGQLLGGQLHFVSLLPRALTVVATGDPNVDRRFQVGVTGNSGLPGRVFTAWLRQLPYGKLGKDATCFQLQWDSVCIYTRGALDTSEGLDAFCERAARIAHSSKRRGISDQITLFVLRRDFAVGP